MTTEAVRFDRMEAGLRAWVTALVPGITVVWSGQYPRERATASYATLNKIAGPRSAGRGSWSRPTHTLPMTCTATITAATVGSVATLRASGRKFSYEAQAGDDIEAVRDGLLAAIGSDPMVSATFVASGADAIAIAALSVGDLYRVSGQGLCSVATNTSQACKVQIDQVVSVVRLQIFSADRRPRLGASRYMANVLGARQLDHAVAALDEYGLDVVPGDPIDLDALAGPVWESRSAVDLEVMQVSLSARAGRQITEVRTDVLVRTVLDEFTVDVVESDP